MSRRRRAAASGSPRPALLPAGWRQAATAVARRPDLWPVAARSAAALAPQGWWRRAPFLPLPDRDWMHVRLVTAYGGDGGGPMAADDVITWLEWRRTWDR